MIYGSVWKIKVNSGNFIDELLKCWDFFRKIRSIFFAEVEL